MTTLPSGHALPIEPYLARQLGLQVAEVGVRAEERDGTKVRIAIDALAMLGEALAVR